MTYSYDTLFRLTGETVASDPGGINGAVAYEYDPAGNRLSRTSTLAGVPAKTNTFDANDRVVGDTYDLNGSPVTSGAKTYAYDFETRLKQIDPGGMSITYDGDGNRVATTVGGVTTRHLVDSLNPTGYAQVLEELVGGTVQRVYTYGPTRISQRQLISGSWVTSFYGYDGQGGVRFLTDTTGAVTDQYTYDAFGVQLAATGTTPNVYRYMGEPMDQALQMVYLRARYMNPASGRFWTMDTAVGNPFDPPSLHRYLFASNDPVNRFDPLGLATLDQGNIVHVFIGMEFMAEGYFIHMFDRLSGSGKGRRCLRKILEQRFAFPGSGEFPDLVDFELRFMFEIKTRKQFGLGVEQLKGYLATAQRFDPLWRAGTIIDFVPFPVVPCDNSMTCIAFVDPPVEGVITYDEWDLRPTLLTIAVIAVLGALALALLAPFLAGITELVAAMGTAAAAWGAASAAELAIASRLAQP